MRVIILCEFSGIVRDAFIAAGHDAISCDLMPTERPGPHLQMDCRNITNWQDYDLLIGHPPCDYLTNSASLHLYIDGHKENGPDPERWRLMHEAAEFFKWMLNLPVPRICLENPVMVGYAKKIIGVSQAMTFQPWKHGHGEIKRTCLWLKNLPELKPSNIVEGREPRVHHGAPGPNRKKNRSRTLEGIGKAMASQWADLAS